jgi:hypothetical protein
MFLCAAPSPHIAGEYRHVAAVLAMDADHELAATLHQTA